ncbi:LOW QUALITY PROTEIN: GDSL esterase/lipase At1g71250-like [Asparagus officinalis]|uniref:LOW QUALITY PROTEIN: GDSL esterase/lipase At1g71250-like n=1 Tax=Asparagus officinalis TaxID=4686 RepID=UPI00098E4D15|nr:LOW QUALITY PROTEIN: GDSL esterase/lipase At1g71250-like [Asparagus officinalis]
MVSYGYSYDMKPRSVGVLSDPQVPALFVFGDSLADDGNNNYMSSIAKANYYPYGIDFFQGPTGRFGNGKTAVDILCDLLGLPYLPPYTSPFANGTALLGGVNYASAAGGILDESGQYLGERYSLSQQVLNFESNLNQLRSLMPAGDLSQHLARSIAVFAIGGSNDYINNYLLPFLYPTRSNYTPEQYANLLLNRYARQLLALYDLGLRKFFLVGIGPLGCTPNQRATGLGPPGRCVDQVNQMLGPFNVGLRTLAQQLNTNHPGAIFVYGNTYGALGDILNNPSTYGFTVIDRACCGLGRNQGQITCLPFAVPCSNRDQHVFWDAFHPTQAVNMILAQRAFTGPPTDCFPINVQQMAQL